MRDHNHWNAIRYDGTPKGHYESYFQRANHPSEPRAFWIRYTVFSPKGRPGDALEYWFSWQRFHSATALTRV